MRSGHRTAAGALGIVATVALHFLLFAVAVWGDGGLRVARLPDAVGAGANSGKPDGTSAERMVVILLSLDVTESSAASSESPQLSAELIKQQMLQVTGPDVRPPPPLEFEDEGEATEASDADLIARTRLAGIYESQIRARIERSWSQPVERLNAPVYSCRVNIRQKRDGVIEDVKLEKCEGSFEWLDSLVNAIYSASPLPGPPHPGVFVDSFSMQFRSTAKQ